MTFSPSRITTWMNCQRKAGWIYIAGYEDPGTDATDFGTLVHAELETTKKTPGYLPNRLTDVGAVASEALPYVEDFSLADGATVEGNFTLQGRHAWQGYIDLRKPGHVLDYKTTSDFKWAKTAHDLLVDPQAVVYAKHELTRWRGPYVNLTWLYLRKRRPFKAHAVHLQMPRSHADRAFDALETFADEMQAAALGAPASPPEKHRYVLDVLQPNTDHCDAYGGCPHKSRCGISFFSSPQNSKGKTVNLLERLQQMDAAASNPAAVAPPARAEAAPMMGAPTPFVSPLTAGAPLQYAPPPPVSPEGLPAWATAPVDPPHAAAFGPNGAFAGTAAAAAPFAPPTVAALVADQLSRGRDK